MINLEWTSEAGRIHRALVNSNNAWLAATSVGPD